jgi:YhcH/YjgK/YiaL family protein
MILSTLADAHRSAGLHPLFPTVFAWLAAPPALPAGRHCLVGDQLAVIVESGTTLPRSAKRLESHRRFIDIQVSVAGGEVMDWAPLSGLAVHTPYDAERDVGFWNDPAELVSVLVRPGWFTIFWPEDAHRPGLHPGSDQAAYRKLVFKIAI